MKQRTRYQKVSKGVYLYLSTKKNTKNTYRVRKTIKGIITEAYFTNKALAIKAYKSF